MRCILAKPSTLVALLALALGTRGADGQEIVSEGPADPRLASFDQLMIGFLQRTKVPGASIAVAKGSRLVYARGFGYADVEAKEPVRPISLFRIASVSKPITSAAIMQLAEKGKLKLDDKVFDVLHLESKAPPGAKIDPRWRQVTIRELLQHRGGWDRDKSFDPMFRQVDFARAAGAKPPAGPAEIIRAMLGQPFDFNPGQRYAYSNFGYSLLGRAIEQVSGEPYEKHVQAHVLAPLGIHDMRIGRTRLEGRARGEVRYYQQGSSQPTGPSIYAADFGKPVLLPYGTFSIETLDAHGGWIASAVDLVRFGSALNDDAAHRILSRPAVHESFARPPGLAGKDKNGRPLDVYYGFGWEVRGVGPGQINTWHTGLIDGTSTILVRRSDGLTWAVLFNCRKSAQGNVPAGEIDSLVHGAADAVREWPTGDLFPRFLGAEDAHQGAGRN